MVEPEPFIHTMILGPKKANLHALIYTAICQDVILIVDSLINVVEQVFLLTTIIEGVITCGHVGC